MTHSLSRRLVGPALALLAPLVTACSSDVVSDARCEAFDGDFSSDTSLDANVRLFMQASADFKALADDLKGPVKTACANVAKDLGADDSWSDLDGDKAISNSDGTGACDVASARINAIMTSSAAATANFALVVTSGVCVADFEAQAACDAKCAAEQTCTPGTVETRCEPASLSVQCSGTCNLEAVCEGTPELPANCMGVCESTCQGECKGTCIAADGTRTDNDPNCRGKCSSSCNGICRGRCKIDKPEGLACGTSVSCCGGCTGTATEAKCESTFTPPQCTVDATCHESCSASVAANAVCTPPHVELLANVSASADVQALVTTINANLPPLIALAHEKGDLVVNAAAVLVARGKAVLSATGDLNAKSLACATVAAEASVSAALTLQVSVSGSLKVTESCQSHAI